MAQQFTRFCRGPIGIPGVAAFFSRKRDVGLLISIFFGFVAYIALAQIGLAIFARMHLL
jgi:hypothetical protein